MIFLIYPLVKPEKKFIVLLPVIRGIAQLVARLLWEQEVVGSNPTAPTSCWCMECRIWEDIFSWRIGRVTWKTNQTSGCRPYWFYYFWTTNTERRDSKSHGRTGVPPWCYYRSHPIWKMGWWYFWQVHKYGYCYRSRFCKKMAWSIYSFVRTEK